MNIEELLSHPMVMLGPHDPHFPLKLNQHFHKASFPPMSFLQQSINVN